MMTPYYSHSTPIDAVMAEQDDDGIWTVQRMNGTPETIPNDMFLDMYTGKAPHEYHKRPGHVDPIDPVALAEAGTHDLVYCKTKEHLDEIAEAHPDAWFLNMTSGGAQQRPVMPSLWVGWVTPGEDIIQEKNAVYGFPLLAVIPRQ